MVDKENSGQEFAHNEGNNQEEGGQKIQQGCEEQYQQLQERYVRLTADLENYKRRVEKEKSTWISSAQAGILKELLPIIDDFDRAITEYQQYKQPEQQAWITGFQMIHKSLQKLLQHHEVEEIEQVKIFDPQLHEALTQVVSTDHASGEIVQVFEKGYRFKDQILRPAKVSVAQ